jgi:hypothetical protein
MQLQVEEDRRHGGDAAHRRRSLGGEKLQAELHRAAARRQGRRQHGGTVEVRGVEGGNDPGGRGRRALQHA